jgi:signal transduction histidine kinase
MVMDSCGRAVPVSILTTVNSSDTRVPQIAGYRTFLAVVAISYFTLIALLPYRWGPPDMRLLVPASLAYLVMGIWGFEYATRVRKLPVSLAYLLIEFAIGIYVNRIALDGTLPVILLPIAAQAVWLLPRWWAVAICVLVIIGVSGYLSWVPTWPAWFRNLAIATAGVSFVVVYVSVAVRERTARERIEQLSSQVADLAAANERNRLAREIHDTLGHYLTVIHVQLEAAKALSPTDAEKAALAINRAQSLAKDGLAAVRQSVKALRDNTPVQSVSQQLRSLVEAVRDESFAVTLSVAGTERPVRPAVALALHRAALEAITNVRRHANARRADVSLTFGADGRVSLGVKDDGVGAEKTDGGFGLVGLRERAEDLGGRLQWETAPGNGFALTMELPS